MRVRVGAQRRSTRRPRSPRSANPAEGAYAFTCDVTDSASVDHTVKDILGQFGHVDYLVNNAGRSIRRSVSASTDRLHDYERVMAVNYFGSVRMVLALLPHWRERRFGHVVNVSSAGVQASSPKYSAYIPSKAALDAFAEVVGTETLSDHITFTSIHMPLVETPMIAPSRKLNPMPAITADHAAAMVVRGLVDKPARIDTPSARWPTSGCTSRRSCPAASCIRSSSAIRIRRPPGVSWPPRAAVRTRAGPATQAPRSLGGGDAAGARPLKRAVRLVPGVHW